ncbi:family 1 glycosylhydrolase [Leifsonia shinshuensis]|nr:family 1 glycosylhydrolase [Leifsonia shinshuensis]
MALSMTGGRSPWPGAGCSRQGPVRSTRQAVDRSLGDRVPGWLTLSEPYCSAFVGHLEGRHAPGIRDEATAVIALHHLLLAHGKGVQTLRAEGATGQLGITLYPTSVRAGDPPPRRRRVHDATAHRHRNRSGPLRLRRPRA